MRTRTSGHAVLIALIGVGLAPIATQAATGGPDSLGYTWADSDEPYVTTNKPRYTPTPLIPLGYTGDEAVIQLTIPPAVFPSGFPFYGATYTSLWLSTNGWLSFVDPALNPAPITATVPNTAPPNGLVAFFWDDWTVTTAAPAAQAGPSTDGKAYVIQARYARVADPTVMAQITIALVQGGRIDVYYDGAVQELLSPRTTIGIENGPGAVGLPYMSAGAAQSGAAFRDLYAVSFLPAPRLSCVGAPTLPCNAAPLTASNAAPPGRVAAYGCATGLFDGNEAAFLLQLAQTSHVNITLANTDLKNRSLFLMQASCNEQSGCIAGGTTTLDVRFLPPGDYYVVVDGVTTADNGGPFDLSATCLNATVPVACGATVAGTTSGGRNDLEAWKCAPVPLSGPEVVYELDLGGGPVTLEAALLLSANPDLHAVIASASGFNPSFPTCLDADPTTATAWAAPAGRYYIAVDGANGASDSYNLNVSCGRQLACPSPGIPIDVQDPTPIQGDTTGKSSSVDRYSCARSAYGPPGETSGYTGPEDVYEFTISTPVVVAFRFTSDNPDQHLLILSDCYEGNCLSEGGCAEALPAGTYRLVVDGRNGATGPYTIAPLLLPVPTAKRWWECPECFACPQTPETVRSKQFSFNSQNYCGTGCDFSLYAVVECGYEFHTPFFDVETGALQIYDVLRGQYLPLVADNRDLTCPLIMTGTQISWDDAGCSAIPCPDASCGGGTDCRTNDVTLDVWFNGTPTVCGVFRLDFSRWGGFEWDAYANCTGDSTQQFYLYADLCSALANYNPRPEIGIAAVTLDPVGCLQVPPHPSGTMTIENIGCVEAVGIEIVVTEDPPGTGAPRVFPVTLGPGQQATFPWDYLPTLAPTTLNFRVDPAGRVAECSESLGSVSTCGVTGTTLRDYPLPVCQNVTCVAIPDPGQSVTLCEGVAYTLDGLQSILSCLSPGIPEYRWEDVGGVALPGCDWSTSPLCPMPTGLLPGMHVFQVAVRCANSTPDCEDRSPVVITIESNVAPAALGNVLRAVETGPAADFSWAPLGTLPISEIRLYKDGDPELPVGTRLPVTIAPPWTIATSDPGAIANAPTPVAYYQLVTASCQGDIEGPY